MDIKSVEDLYKRVEPALEIKSKELQEKGYFISTKDIFEILKRKWITGHNLTLYDITSDIMKFDMK